MTNLKDIHRHCSCNRAELQQSKICGCFYCLQIYDADEIIEYVGVGETTALCSRCHIDSVIADVVGVEITEEFLEQMKKRWFGSDSDIEVMWQFLGR